MPLIRQAAVIAVRDQRVCLVLSSSGKRWVVPKGHIEPGQSAGETALQEAWEEAGLVGTLQPQALGAYRYEKDGIPRHVTVFLMDVVEQAAVWPEMDRRERSWVSLNRALARLAEPGLRRLVARAVSEQRRLALA